MSRWFRHYAGLCRDEKLVSAAIKSKQPVERVVWLWCAILESAAEIDDDGWYGLDLAEAAYFLRADEGDLGRIVDCLETLGRLSQGRVVRWGNRQFKSDRSAERVAAHRERKRSERGGDDVDGTSRNGAVTLQEQHRNAPETETETELEKIELNPDTKSLAQPSVGSPANATVDTPAEIKPPRGKTDYSADFELVWSEWPKSPNEAKKVAFDRYRRLSAADREAVLDGVMAQALWLAEEEASRAARNRDPPPRLHLSTFISERRWETLLQTRFNKFGRNPWQPTPQH